MAAPYLHSIALPCRRQSTSPYKKRAAKNDDQLREAVKCTLDRDSYVEILREKGVLG